MIQNKPEPLQEHKDNLMATDKYDISKSLKFSSKNIEKMSYLVQQKNFKNDSEAMRYCLDLVVALSKHNLLTEATAKLIENME